MDTEAVQGREYRPRVIDGALQRALRTAGAVVIEGARASGKTMTALHAAGSHVFLDDDEMGLLASVAPKSLLDGPSPRLLDEWTNAPVLWNLVRRSVDASPATGRFILTGSAVPADEVTRHTGAGRFLRLRQRTMSWWEKLDEPSGAVSLASLFAGEKPAADLGAGIELEAIVGNLLRPGFPAMTELAPDDAADLLRGYIDDVTRADIRRIADIRHEPAVLQQLIASLARAVASPVSHRTLASDMRSIAPTIDAETVGRYVGLLERLFVIESQQAWAPKLRSRATVRVSSKMHLVDPALAAVALRAGPERLMGDLQTLGFLFESAVVHDLTVLASGLRGEVKHYQDSYGNEIDAVVTLPDGRWGAVEVKLGGAQLPKGIESLARAVAQIETESEQEPSFRLVVTGTGPILVADDGTVTAPLSALAP
ncbi:ATP-binding protein [Demequina capsici]|uniref:DUF4143 domain-containing protein n=1 Tax=Demequina capsici TaxID=3075620 RepID=A0AA96F652_9MICO|nr:DUF4143 domain-containing protein [Demequina sp. OYTSA14]WNM24399.1 DUF4143 domain-containing protein [Demequina sp. OYTSA14]